MAQSLKSKKTLNMVYGLGASIVLIGALFKILHFHIGFLTGGVMLTIGLLTEAFIFAYSAFYEPIEEDLDWSKVYPELKGGTAREKKLTAEGVLTKKLDAMLREANLDAELVKSLSQSIQSFKGAAESINETAQTVASTQKYNEEMATAAMHLQALNGLYKLQSENSERQAQINESMMQHSEKLEQQMEALASNLASLNNVYGGMLSAMNK
jgi:gliding motility-associated protein GldL